MNTQRRRHFLTTQNQYTRFDLAGAVEIIVNLQYLPDVHRRSLKDADIDSIASHNIGDIL